MRWKNHKIVAFDTETTGLDPFDSDRIIEFGAVVFELGEDGSVSRTDHNWLINPERRIPRLITDITGISNEDVEDAPVFSDIADNVHELLSDVVTVAHNYPFDLSFISEEFRRLGSFWPEPLAEIDTIDLSRRIYPDAKSHKLSELCDRVGVTLEQAHRATDDAAACGQCFIQLAQRHHIEDDLQVMLDWAKAIGRPPESGPLAISERGTPIFSDGPHKGDAVAEHPIYMGWMLKARVPMDGCWDFRFDAATRAWVERWLQVRGSGRTHSKSKIFKAKDWGPEKYLVAMLKDASFKAAVEEKLEEQKSEEAMLFS